MDKASIAIDLGFHVEKADHGEDHRTDEVDQQVAHGINEANIQIAAHPKGVWEPSE